MHKKYVRSLWAASAIGRWLDINSRRCGSRRLLVKSPVHATDATVSVVGHGVEEALRQVQRSLVAAGTHVDNGGHIRAAIHSGDGELFPTDDWIAGFRIARIGGENHMRQCHDGCRS